jgi:hypothetical protein
VIMSRQYLLKNATDIKALAERLSSCPEVVKYDSGGESEAEAIAYDFAHIEESSRKLLDEHFPRLAENIVEPSDICGVLDAIGDELLHVEYHIKDSNFYRYLQVETDSTKMHTTGEAPSRDDEGRANALAELVSRCPEVVELDQGEPGESTKLAQSLMELEASIRKIVGDQFPRLIEGCPEPSQTHDLLLEMGDEFRRVLIAIETPRFYAYVIQSGNWPEAQPGE